MVCNHMTGLAGGQNLPGGSGGGPPGLLGGVSRFSSSLSSADESPWFSVLHEARLSVLKDSPAKSANLPARGRLPDASAKGAEHRAGSVRRGSPVISLRRVGSARGQRPEGQWSITCQSADRTLSSKMT